MTQKALILFAALWILLVFPSVTPAQQATGIQNSSGRVADKAENVAIPKAIIWIHEQSGGPSYTVRPDRAGSFVIQLPDGYYDVMIGSSGFAPFCKSIWVHAGRPIHLDVRLGPDYENLQD
jgi:hypothetical protein